MCDQLLDPVRCVRTDAGVELTLKGEDTDKVLNACGKMKMTLSEVAEDGTTIVFKVTDYKEQGGVGKMQAEPAVVPEAPTLTTRPHAAA